MPRSTTFPPNDVWDLDNKCAIDSRIQILECPRAYIWSGKPYTVQTLDPAQPVPVQVNGVLAVRVKPLDRISIWCGELVGDALNSLPPAIRLDLRLGFNSVTTLAASLNVLPPNWNDADLLFQFSGIVATQFELWAGTFDGGPGRPAVFVPMTFHVQVDTSGCCEKHLEPGPWVIP